MKCGRLRQASTDTRATYHLLVSPASLCTKTFVGELGQSHWLRAPQNIALFLAGLESLFEADTLGISTREKRRI